MHRNTRTLSVPQSQRLVQNAGERVFLVLRWVSLSSLPDLKFLFAKLMLTSITGYFAEALSAIEKKATHLILLSSMLREVFFFLFFCFCILPERMIPEFHFAVRRKMAPRAELWVNRPIHLFPYRGFDHLICNARTFVNEFLTGSSQVFRG